MLNVTLAFGLSDIGGGEILVIGVIALLLFGKNLPTVMRNLGKAYGQFKTTLNAASSEFKKEIDIAAEELEKAKREADVKKELSTVSEDLNKSINSTLNDEPSPSPQSEYTEPPALVDDLQPKPRPAPPDSIDQSPSSLDSAASAPAAKSTDVAEAPKPAASPISLDQLEKKIAPPKKIPPPI